MKTQRLCYALLVALLSFVTGTAHGDTTPSPAATVLRQRGYTKSIAGAVLVTVGAVLSTVMVATGAPIFLREASRDEGGTLGRDLLIASVPVGTALLLAGLPLVVSGHDDRDRAARLAAPPALVTLRY